MRERERQRERAHTHTHRGSCVRENIGVCAPVCACHSLCVRLCVSRVPESSSECPVIDLCKNLRVSPYHVR